MGFVQGEGRPGPNENFKWSSANVLPQVKTQLGRPHNLIHLNRNEQI